MEFQRFLRKGSGSTLRTEIAAHRIVREGWVGDAIAIRERFPHQAGGVKRSYLCGIVVEGDSGSALEHFAR